MRHCSKFCLTAVLLLMCAGQLFAQASGMEERVKRATAKGRNAPEIPYESAPNFFKLPPGLYLGEAMGVATNSKGHIFVMHRRQGTYLFEFDQNGNFVREIGKGFYGFAWAHAVRVDKDDNIWTVDEGTDTVVKWNPQGRPVMVLGRRPELVRGVLATPERGSAPPPARDYTFGRQTDVAFDPQGNIFISDGYTNSRVVKYDKNGRFVKAVGGERGSAPLQFSTPHGIQVDNQGNVYVADRGNFRVQVLDNDLNLKAIYDTVGSPWTVCITPGPHQYLYVSNSYPDANNSLFAKVSGEIYKMELDGTILGKFGKPGKQLGDFGTTHGIDCRNENQLFVSEITNWRVQKITLRPQPQSQSRQSSTVGQR